MGRLKKKLFCAGNSNILNWIFDEKVSFMYVHLTHFYSQIALSGFEQPSQRAPLLGLAKNLYYTLNLIGC